MKYIVGMSLMLGSMWVTGSILTGFIIYYISTNIVKLILGIDTFFLSEEERRHYIAESGKDFPTIKKDIQSNTSIAKWVCTAALIVSPGSIIDLYYIRKYAMEE